MALAALVPALVSLFFSWTRYATLQREIRGQRARAKLLESRIVVPTGKLPAMPDSPEEHAQFVTDMTAAATASGCALAHLEAQPAPNTAAASPARQAQIRLRGRYPQVRHFLSRVLQARRTYAVTELSLAAIAAADAGAPRQDLEASITVERYVVPASGRRSGAGSAG